MSCMTYIYIYISRVYVYIYMSHHVYLVYIYIYIYMIYIYIYISYISYTVYTMDLACLINGFVELFRNPCLITSRYTYACEHGPASPSNSSILNGSLVGRWFIGSYMLQSLSQRGEDGGSIYIWDGLTRLTLKNRTTQGFALKTM